MEQALYEQAIKVADKICNNIRKCCGILWEKCECDKYDIKTLPNHYFDSRCNLIDRWVIACEHQLRLIMQGCHGRIGDNYYREITKKIFIKPGDDNLRIVALQCLVFKYYNIITMGYVNPGEHPYFLISTDPTFRKHIYMNVQEFRQSLYKLEQYIFYAEKGFTYEWVITMSTKLFEELDYIRKACEAAEINEWQDITMAFEETIDDISFYSATEVNQIAQDALMENQEAIYRALYGLQDSEWRIIELEFWRGFGGLYAKTQKPSNDNSSKKS